MKHRRLIYILLIVVYGCCRSEYKGEVKLSNLQKSINPYSVNDIITFTDNNNNIIEYSVESRVAELMHRENGGCADCCVDYYDVEWDRTSITSSFHNSSFSIILFFEGPFPPGTNRVPIMMSSYTINDGTSNGVQTSFENLPIDSIQSHAISNGFFADSLIIRSRIFEDVYILKGSSYQYPDELICDTLYYTKEEGIIGMKLSDGNLLEKQ